MKKLFLLLKIVFVICITSYAPPAFGWGVSNHEDISPEFPCYCNEVGGVTPNLV